MPIPKVMVAVAAIIENEKGEVLLIKRSPIIDYPNCWEDVGGRLKQSEKPSDGLLREIKEETGITDIEIIKPLTIFHIFRKGVKTVKNECIGISYWCKTKTSKVVLSTEHSDYKWTTPENAIEITGHKALKNYLQIYLQKKALEKKIDLLKLR